MAYGESIWFTILSCGFSIDLSMGSRASQKYIEQTTTEQKKKKDIVQTTKDQNMGSMIQPKKLKIPLYKQNVFKLI